MHKKLHWHKRIIYYLTLQAADAERKTNKTHTKMHNIFKVTKDQKQGDEVKRIKMFEYILFFLCEKGGSFWFLCRLE